MAFTVGWPDGSSVVSVEYADQHFADRGGATWTGEDSLKEAALVRATDYVRAMFSHRFDPDLFVNLNGDPSLPPELERAVVEYAVIELRTPGALTQAPVYDPSGHVVVTTKKKIGPIEKNFSVVGGSSGPATRRSFPLPDSFIAALLLPIAHRRVTR